MSQQEQAALVALECLKGQGAEHAQASATVERKHELNFQHAELSLLRTTTDHSLSLTAIRGGRRAQLGLNQLHRDAIQGAAADVAALSDAGSADPAYAIAPAQKPKSFSSGPAEAEVPKMRDRLEEFLATVKQRHPSLILEDGFLAFQRADSVFANSNGVRWASAQGYYSFFAMFTAKEGPRMSSFNYVVGNLRDLEAPLVDCFGTAELLEQCVGQLDARPVSGKFEGEILITPHCLRDLLESYLGYLGDGPLISGTSVLKEKLGQRVASPLLTLTADPGAADLTSPEFFDGEGFEAEPMVILENGVLRSYLLSLYGANRTGLRRALNSGSRYSLAAGGIPRVSLLAGMKKGILLTRFSGGRPAPNGDFSGIAKNSYYVENGEVRHALTETMVSGNLLRLFDSVSGLSRETLTSGNKRVPWLLAGGVTVSGKA